MDYKNCKEECFNSANKTWCKFTKECGYYHYKNKEIIELDYVKNLF